MEMIYLTVPREPRKAQQLNFSQMLLMNSNSSLFAQMNKPIKDTFDTATYFIEESRVKQELIDKFDTEAVIEKLEKFIEKYNCLYEVDRHNLYHKFWLPKKSKPHATRHCDMREINAPNEELKEALYELKEIFEKDFMVKYHTSAFAYIAHRSIKMCIERHQSNNSKWFLKLDFKNFFPNTNETFIMNQLSRLFPFNLVVKTERGRQALQQAINLCILDGGLPQGTPISPLITNVVMIAIDYQISKTLATKAKEKRFCYTRYADDILISSPYEFDFHKVEETITNILNHFGASFWLNTEKTRYGSSSGRNWNLGLMLNKDNQITIGHEKKNLFKAQLNNFILDFINKGEYDYHATQKLRGIMSYYESIEKEFVDKVITSYNKKYNCDVRNIFKMILSGTL